MNKKIFTILAVGFLIISAVAITGCTDSNDEDSDNGGTDDGNTDVTVNYEVTTDLSTAYLSVTVEGPEKDYDIHLSNPNGESTGTGFISSDDMASGHETVDVSMAESGENPISGEYTLTVEEYISEDTVFEGNPTFDGADVSITDVQLEYEYDDALDDWDMTDVTLNISNDGDLPIFLDEGQITVAGESEDLIFADKGIPLDGTQSDHSVFILDVQEEDSVTVEIYSDGGLIDSYDTTVELPE